VNEASQGPNEMPIRGGALCCITMWKPMVMML
jgi:hypothetical protein